MAWTEKQRKAHSQRMKAAWARRVEAKEAQKVVDVIASQDWAKAHAPKDLVNHPPHYTFGKYEVADVADDWYPTEPHLWQANKYMARWDKKGDPIENLEKSIWYLNRKISQLKEKRNAQVKP